MATFLFYQSFYFRSLTFYMMENEPQTMMEDYRMMEEYRSYLNDKAFPCIGAKAALAKGHVKCMVAGHMACPADDRSILQFLYDFVDEYRGSGELFHSAAILFRGPLTADEGSFDAMLWQRLQALADLDAKNYGFDPRVNEDPSSPDFSFSLKEEAFYIIGLHPASSRGSRRFSYPVLAFNPHAQFELLRATDHYESMKAVVRRRDIAFSGSVNPMLDDFGNSSEVIQYSGRRYASDWLCPLKINHTQSAHHADTDHAQSTPDV
jgi:FPC/CPF motif-containing protein YcgG